jgi:site-specific recombinase XerD
MFINVNTISTQIQRIAGKLKIPNLSPHSFRHTFATHGISIGISLFVISTILGHSDVKTTQIYAKMLNMGIEDELERLGM